MTRKAALAVGIVLGVILLSTGSIRAQRHMENLSRGVVAINQGNGKVYVGWRMLGTDPDHIAFNLYRSTGGGATVRLNSQPITESTNWVDNQADLSQSNTYFVRPVLDGQELSPSAPFTLPAGAPVQKYISIPLQSIGDYYVHLAWVGDLDGDGEYDFVVNRLPNVTGQTPKVEAYKRDGTFLWRVDMGPNSINPTANDEAPASISGVGNVAGFRDNDNVTVYDLDSDGKAEVLIRTAGGVVFGDGQTLTYGDNTTQFISVIDGLTGAERAYAVLPQDYIADGPLSGHFGIAYLNGARPSLIFKAENRIGTGTGPAYGFNLMICTYDLTDDNLNLRWKWNRGTTNAPSFHQIRIVDVDLDGKDEICDGGYVIDDNGTILYSLGPNGITHGDRFHIGDLDPDRPGLEGFGVQQDNPSLLGFYYYDAATGQILREHYLPAEMDVGRGSAADLDPNHRGYEYWTSADNRNIYNAQTSVQVPGPAPAPNPNFRIWWDGDVLSEHLTRAQVDKWDTQSLSWSRQLSAANSGATYSWRDAAPFYGDIFGDWREEIIFEKYDHTELQIFTTTIPSDVRFYTLAHNPEYRACFTVRGYLQSNMIDYYLGNGMSTPPRPDIRVVYGDFTGDGKVDIDDLPGFVEFWLVTDCNNVGLDWNGDCTINFYEYSLLAQDWLEGLQ